MHKNFKIDTQVANFMELFMMMKQKSQIYYHSHKNKKCQLNNNYKQSKEDMMNI